MLIKKPADIKSSEITDKQVYLNRRGFMRGATLAATTAATALLYRKLNPAAFEKPPGEKLLVTSTPDSDSLGNGFITNETRTPIEDITNYNNFYEFSTDKQSVARASANFVTRPWNVIVDGLVN